MSHTNLEKKISVVINTYNAEKHLAQVVDSVKHFDEIIVCDMESTDDTITIAKSMGCKVITFPKGNYNIVEPARQFAIDHATHPWILVVDADELISEQLRAYLYRHIATPNCADGLYIPRKNYFMGQFLHAHYPDYILRFFRKEVAHWPAVIHAVPQINGTISYIPKRNHALAIEHLANDSIATLFKKTDTYSDYEVPRRRHKNYGAGSLFTRPVFRFFKSYILKGGFRDGAPGFIHAVWDAFYQFAVVAKLIEERKNKS